MSGWVFPCASSMSKMETKTCFWFERWLLEVTLQRFIEASPPIPWWMFSNWVSRHYRRGWEINQGQFATANMTWKKTNMIKIGIRSLFWDDLKFLCGEIINIFYCILGFSSETEPESPRITFLPLQMYWCKPKPKLPVRSCWAYFLLGADKTLKSPPHRSCLWYY